MRRRKVAKMFLTGILIFGVIFLRDFHCIGSQSSSDAKIWVDKGCGSTYSDGESIVIYFKVISPAPSAGIHIIDRTPDGKSNYLIYNECVYTNVPYYIDGFVTCPPGLETIEIVVTVVVNGETLHLRDACSFFVTGCGTDKDGDGYYVPDDCDDNDLSVYPGATEVCDGKDNDCDGNIDEGFDKDSDGYTTCNGDCDDNDLSVYPGATEVCDGKDNDCDKKVDEGFDKDSDGYTTCNGDCDDNDASIRPGVIEVCDGKDNDCDGLIDEGFDKDSDGYTTCNGDTNDNDATVHPGAEEICDGKDNDGDGLIDEGFDKDNDKYTECNGDCDDNDPRVYPGAEEICDGKDNDCDKKVDEGFDKDSDGYTECNGDPDDNDATVHPGAKEICDGKDNDCDGLIDEDFDKDDDGHTTCNGDCDDDNPQIYPGAPEPCDKDYNCDGRIDLCTGNLEISVVNSKGEGLRAKVYVNGKYAGKTDSTGVLTIYDLEAGKYYTIEAKKQGYSPKTETIEVEKNNTKPVVIYVERNYIIYFFIGLLFCSVLAFPIYKIKNNQKTRLKTIQTQICPVCKIKIQKNVKSCPYCGVNLKDKTIPYDEDKTRIYEEGK